MWTIARLNWPLYASAIAVLIVALIGLIFFPEAAAQIVCATAVAGTVYFLLGSLGVSHLIYDRSDLYQGLWLNRVLRGATRDRFIICHAGFDDSSQILRERCRNVEWQVLDHFDESRMTESSIRRARQMFPPGADTLWAAYNHWPTTVGAANVVFGLLAIHELRSEEERTAWFTEAKRCLRKDGRIVLVEHIRNLANFLAFGPGAFHFHSRENWRVCWERADLRCVDEFPVTPWVRVFVLVVS